MIQLSVYLVKRMAAREMTKKQSKAGGLIRWENHPQGKARGVHTGGHRHKAAPGRIIQYNLQPHSIYSNYMDDAKNLLNFL